MIELEMKKQLLQKGRVISMIMDVVMAQQEMDDAMKLKREEDGRTDLSEGVSGVGVAVGEGEGPGLCHVGPVERLLLATLLLRLGHLLRFVVVQ